jgi:hypothetical protein
MPKAAGKDAAPVRRYLEALENHRPKRGRKRTPESVTKKLEDVRTKIAAARGVQRLALVQERLDLERELAAMKAAGDLGRLEADFVKSAKAYSEAKKISYTAWRELGVSAEVLRKAGVPRTRRASV